MPKEKGLLNEDAMSNPQNLDSKNSESLDKFVIAGVSMIHNNKMSDQLIQTVLNAQEPAEAIADATLLVVKRIEKLAESKGDKIPMEIIAHGANFLMGDIIKSAELSGLPKLSEDEKAMAYSLAVSKYIDQGLKSGEVTPMQLQQMSEQAKGTPEGKKILSTAEGAIGEMQQPVMQQGGSK